MTHSDFKRCVSMLNKSMLVPLELNQDVSLYGVSPGQAQFTVHFDTGVIYYLPDPPRATRIHSVLQMSAAIHHAEKESKQ